jgi:hypothetical protein
MIVITQWKNSPGHPLFKNWCPDDFGPDDINENILLYERLGVKVKWYISGFHTLLLWLGTTSPGNVWEGWKNYGTKQYKIYPGTATQSGGLWLHNRQKSQDFGHYLKNCWYPDNVGPDDIMQFITINENNFVPVYMGVKVELDPAFKHCYTLTWHQIFEKGGRKKCWHSKYSNLVRTSKDDRTIWIFTIDNLPRRTL